MAQKLKTFEVVRTPKIKDATGAYCRRGETCQLTKELAEHYHKLGYIRVQMDTLFNDADDNDNGTDTGAAEATDDSGPDDAQPVSEAGSVDESAASEDAETDAGTGASKTRGRLASNRRRKRASS